jgi:glycosyltransferase involved in cell wall biosynthesis
METKSIVKKKVTYIISLVHKSSVFEWTALGLNEHYDITFLLLNSEPSALEDFLIQHQIKTKRIKYRGKQDFILASIKTFSYLLLHRPNIVHAHLFDAQLIGLTTAKLLGIEKRIYTRHNSNYHHVYHPQGIRFDRWSNQMATQVISISQSTYKTLQNLEQVPTQKIVTIPHGFDLESFNSASTERIEQIRTKWKISGQHVIGVIARHIEWKGIQYIIPAFEKFIKTNPSACLVLANATGPYNKEIKNLLANVPAENVVLIPFEEDAAALYKCFTIYVHTPVDNMCEAFGQTYVEALAAGIPSIFTLSGIAEQFIEHDKNAYIAKFRDSNTIYDGLEKISSDERYRNRLIENGRQSVFPIFENEPVITKLRELYDA